MVLSRASSAQIQEGDGWWGTLDAEGSSSKGKHKAQPSIEDVLEDNVQMIEELVAWQQVRAGSKSTGTPSERESLVGERPIRGTWLTCSRGTACITGTPC